MKIQIFLKDNMPVLSEGEFGITFDTGEVYIGTENGNVKYSFQKYEDITDTIKSLIIESQINGNIRIDDLEIVVYDDSNLVEVLDHIVADFEQFKSTVITHEHDNMEVLSKLSFDDELMYDGQPVNTDEHFDDSLLHDKINMMQGEISQLRTTIETINPYDEENLRMLIENVIAESHWISSLSDLDDVQVGEGMSDGDVLTFDEHDEKWIPKKVDYTIIGENEFILEDFNDDEVILINDDVPEDVTNVTIANIDQTQLTVNWQESQSMNIDSYLIYSNGKKVSSVKATKSKLTPLSYTLTNLTPATEYVITIITKSKSGVTSNGKTIIFSTSGKKALHLNGVSDYIQLPTMTFNQLDLIYEIDEVKYNANFIDARNGGSAKYIGIGSNGTVTKGYTEEALVDGSANDLSLALDGKRTLTMKESQAITDDVTIFAYYIPSRVDAFMPGKVFSIRLFNDDNLIAYYDFTNEFKGASIPDLSGNGNIAELVGGKWIDV